MSDPPGWRDRLQVEAPDTEQSDPADDDPTEISDAPFESSGDVPSLNLGDSSGRSGEPAPDLDEDLVGVDLDDYRLGRCIGTGSMGRVYRAVHRELDVPVAIKVLGISASPRRERAFQREIRAVASLDHPGIVQVFDHGRVPEGIASSASTLRAGSPWFSMELVDGGTLGSLEIGSWGALRTVLIDILDALAHSHARGIVHCDLKPANVLVDRRHPSTGREVALKLSDFGVFAFDTAWHADADARRTAGTPRYMAPEQFRNRRHDLGPPTDLYALGCIAWRLCSGRAPFHQNDLRELVQMHLTAEPPPLRLRFPAPRDLETWLRRLLRKKPQRRFPYAADARRALLALDQHRSDGHQTFVPHSWRSDSDDPGEQIGPSSDVSRGPARLGGIGLGLFGLREVPFTGREAERDSCWQALRSVEREERTRVLVIRGPRGIGTSRLATWLCRRAHELGAAYVLSCTHSPGPLADGPHDGLEAMVRRFLRCEALSRGRTAERLNRLLGDDHDVSVPRLVDWVHHPTHTEDEAVNDDEVDDSETTTISEDDLPVVRFAGLQSRHRILTSFLRALGRRRPVLVRIEDAQWGAEALAFVQHVLTAQSSKVRGGAPPTPVLFVVAIDDDALAGRPRESAALEALRNAEYARALVNEISLRPLGARAQRALIRGMLRLEPELVDRAAAGSAGHPLFGILLVDDWIQRGVLRVDQDRVALCDGATPDIPSDIETLYRAHLDAVTSEIPGARRAIEIAAALGLHVDAGEWRAACHMASTVPDPGLVDQLERWRLARPSREGWSFAHETLRSVIEMDATADGHWGELHLLCARMLEQRYGFGSSLGLGERIGRHLLAAGAFEEALLPLLRGGEDRRRRGDLEGALSVLDLRDAALDEVEARGPTPLPDVTERDTIEDSSAMPRLARARGLIVRARTLATGSRLDEATGCLERVVPIAGQLSRWWRALEAFVTGVVCFKRGDYPQAKRFFERALERYEAEDDAIGIAESELMIGKILHIVERTSAPPHLHAAIEAARRAEDALTYARATMQLGETLLRLGEREAARRKLQRALELFEEIGNPERICAVLNDLGELARFDGELELAEHYYQRAVAGLAGLGSRDAAVPQLNLGIVRFLGGRHGAAREALSEALELCRLGRRKIYAQVCHIVFAAIEGRGGDWTSAREHLDDHNRLYAQSPVHDIDIAHPAAALARAARKAGRVRLSHDAYEVAIRQHEALGRDEEVARLSADRDALADDGNARS